jgi:uridine kinase
MSFKLRVWVDAATPEREIRAIQRDRKKLRDGLMLTLAAILPQDCMAEVKAEGER